LHLSSHGRGERKEARPRRPRPAQRQIDPRDEPIMPKLTAYLAADLFDGATRRRDIAVLVEGDTIRGVAEPGGLPEGIATVELGTGLLAPGFIDLQVNGGGGALLNSAATVDGVRAICEAHAR